MPKPKSSPKPVKHVPLEKWGKDHWSLLAFIEHLCVEYKGCLDDKRRRNMRCNERRHPLCGYMHGQWQPSYGTRLKGYFEDNKLQLPTHDDWDCSEDFEAAGLLENHGSGINPVWKLTPKGLEMSARLRAHKANGGNFSSFTP